MVDNGHVGHVSHSVTTQKIMWVSQFHTGLGLENIESYFFPVEMLNLLKLFFFSSTETRITSFLCSFICNQICAVPLDVF